MAIREHGVSAVTVGDLLDPVKHNLQIPHYQRPYSWEPATALQLVDDIRDSRADPDRSDIPYVLGAVILHGDGDGGRLDVVDGQQRLLTLRMILGILDGHDLLSTSAVGTNAVSRVWTALGRRLGLLEPPDAHALAAFIRNRCEMVRVVTDDVDEAFRVFDSQNYRGKALAPHDLLKAHHLREMREETPHMKAAVVQAWESARDEDLDRLFSTYLYRIARWSRGDGAPGFTTHDIGMFKGISGTSSTLTPANRYHLAAQAALPLLSAWGASGLSDRELGRCKFQLDAPLGSGKPFFDMVAFMLEELKHLVRQGFPADLAPYCHFDLSALADADVLDERAARSRYRYVSELYLAALLYYTNRFGEADLEQARPQLFAWAYALRTEMLRVQYRSVDNRGRGEGSSSAFGLLRNANSGRVVNQLPPAGKPYSDGHEAGLVDILKEWSVR